MGGKQPRGKESYWRTEQEVTDAQGDEKTKCTAEEEEIGWFFKGAARSKVEKSRHLKVLSPHKNKLWVCLKTIDMT